MKNILKYAVVLLILFAMIGTASADVGTVTASAEIHSTNDGNYNVTVSWTGTGSAPYTVTIEGTAIPANDTGVDSATFNDVTLTPGNTYTVNVTDSASTFEITTFAAPIPPTPLSPPVMDNFESTTTAGSNLYSLTWDWVTYPAGTILLYNNSGTWVTVTVVPFEVSGSPASDQKFEFKLNDSTVDSTTTSFEFKKIGFDNATTESKITWTLDTSGWDSFEYNVTKGDGSEIVPITTSSSATIVTPDTLEAATSYTINVRGINGYGYGLWTSNSTTTGTATVDFVDNFESSKEIFNDDNSSNGTKDFTAEAGVTFYINMTATKEVDFTWKLEVYDEDATTWGPVPSTVKYNVENDAANNSSNFSWKPNEKGKYRLNLTMTDTSTTPDTVQELSWVVTVTPSTTGDRIWDESLGMPKDKYTWTARSFSGFYYDLDTGEGSEYMTISNIGRTISKGDIYYETTTSDVDFEYDGWGSYQIVGFMGDKYYAGSGSDSLMKNGNLSKVLLDVDDSENYRVGQYLALEEGYSIRIDQIDVNGNAALLVVEKDGKEVDSGIVNINNNATFTYEKNISGTKVPFIMIHVKSVFMGTESSLVTIDGIFQISDKLLKLESGTEIDKMEIDSVSGNTITMSNSEKVSLSSDSEVTLMGKLKFIVADSDTLRFAPTIEYTDPGIYEIRGTVSDFSNNEYIVDLWTPQNFEGFYYDINDDIENSESIKIDTDLSSTRKIANGELTYTANTTIADYEYETWGQYTVIGFMGEKYYAGTGGGLLSNGNLSKVLVDTDEKRNMYVNQSVSLEEGVSVRASQIDVNGNRALLVVEKDGKELYSEIVQSGNDLNYSKKIGSGSENTTFVKVHVDAVFMGTESSLVTISGIFQASTELTKIEEGTTYGKMEVTSVSSTGIILENDGSLSLSDGDDVEFMKVGNSTMYFKVGDSDDSTLRFAPVVEKEIGSTDPLNVKLSNSTVTSSDVVTITVEDRGVTIEGVTVTVNGSTVGTTNSSGQVNYTTNAVGTFRVNAEKSGYTAGNASLTVNEKLINMTVRVSPETVYFGTAGTIKATDSLNGSAISDATVYISGESIGKTNSSGELNYTFNKTGSVTIDVAKEKYNNGTTTVNVSQEVAFAYSNFALKPDEPSAKKAIKLSFDVTNNGIKDGSHDVSLILRDGSGNVVDQDNKTVSANMGKSKSVSLSVKAPEEGTYTLTLVESDSNRTIDLPSSMSKVSVGSAKLGSTILYIILAFLAIIVIAVIGFVAYLFGVKGANRDNYKMVASEVVDDIKYKFQRK
ncbi:S-layer protein domain-containing protein [Methanimicrococcus blatticola]|uniref:S-layer protein (TIGR01567 family) n=1 Tax=Methanimicrococcus blatticola TaxID=91560 RepID=A0A484F2T2_9EURY|nr:S-layer protein domain-containing protein [Methanimicrococcus blatticola]MBZ3935282.1 hypothetical protein [Methanimicrococcus blatticola]MCC2508620.1 hypothetical protein [Methanimicrococcus blatticola]TDQ67925.1 S-layer protein (TIGR01567 family) [Methanimicrococcus blatticola]